MRRTGSILAVIVALVTALLTFFRARWARLQGRRAVQLALGLGGVLCIAGAVLCSEPRAQAEDGDDAAFSREEPTTADLVRADFEAFEARWAASQEAARQRRAEGLRRLEAIPARERRERQEVRRWSWGSSVETTPRHWSLPDGHGARATATGLLRICISEADGSESDCIGIWQVLRNIRMASCNRRMYRRITECDEGGETLLSAMRRAQRYALGVVPARSRRQRWVSELELSCEEPASWPRSHEEWRHQYGRSCRETAELAIALVEGRDTRRLSRARIIAWGGRCEDERGACDDPIACSRGLARVPTDSLNAFWCRPGSGAPCPSHVDPICGQL